MRHLTHKRRETARLHRTFQDLVDASTTAHLAGDYDHPVHAEVEALHGELRAANSLDDTANCFHCGKLVDLEGPDYTVLTVRQLDHRRGGEYRDVYFARHEYFRIVYCAACGDLLAQHADDTLIPGLP